MSSDLYIDKEGNSFIAIPNKADGNCLFESLAYFRDEAKEQSLESYADNLRTKLCTTYQDIFNKTKRNLDIDLVNSYAYEFNKESQRFSDELRRDSNYKKEEDEFYDVKKSGKRKTYIEHYKHVCKDFVWASASDLVLLSFLIKKVIFLYTKDSQKPKNPIVLQQIYPEPEQENSDLFPKDYYSWPTIHILYNGHSHFEALVPLTNIDPESEYEKKFNEQVEKIKDQANMLPHEEISSIEKENIKEAIRRSEEDQRTIKVSDSQREAIKEKKKEILDNPVSPKEMRIRTSKRLVNRVKGVKEQSLFDNSPSNTKKIKSKKVVIKSPSTKNGQTRKKKKSIKTTSNKITTKEPSPSNKTEVKTSSTIDTSKQVSKTNVDVKKDNVGNQEKAKENVENKKPIQIQLNEIQKSAVEERKEQLYVPKRGQNLVIIKSIRPIANELTLQNDARTLRRIVPNLRKTKKQRKNKFEVKYENGEVYHGSLKNKKKHGLGIYKFKNGDVYMGQYKNGEKHGEGVYQYKDGAKYQGPYVDGKRNGKGVYITPGGKKIEVLFVDNVLVKNK